MSHSLIVGTTQSGKTTLAKKLAGQYIHAGVNVLVLDPLRDPSWPCTFITDDPDEFSETVFKNKKCALFIDEAGESVGRYDGANFVLATRARHWGHNSHFIAQRANLIAPTVRDQCSQAFIFRVSRTDADILAADWCDEKIKAAVSLPAGKCLFASRFQPVTQYSVW